MPKIVDNLDKLEKWNLYINKVDKLEFQKALLENNLSQAQSAAVRAFMKLYPSNKELQDIINPFVNAEILQNKNGNTSKL